ncbi:MAG: HNH endonuclease, partial [Deltaproteobacteria bacterium]|nr:HNH endonuclease [Deltaproteobacteria bacterium]
MSEPRLTSHRKQSVVQRARECCEYCRSQARLSPDPFSIEHIIPRSSGGTDVLTNLALACQGCNNRKYTATAAIDP